MERYKEKTLSLDSSKARQQSCCKSISYYYINSRLSYCAAICSNVMDGQWSRSVICVLFTEIQHHIDLAANQEQTEYLTYIFSALLIYIQSALL